MTVALALLAVLLLLGYLILVRVPVAHALLVAGALGIVLVDGVGSAASAVGRLPYQTSAKYVLIVIPMFILMGVMCKHGGLASDAFNLANRLLGRLPGGLAVATIAACAGFAAVSGSSVATVAALGPMSVDEMRRHGYSTTMAAGVVGAAGTLGVLIPPSVVLVLFGLITGESIGALLIAGIIPGVVSAMAYMAVVMIRAPERSRVPAVALLSGGRTPLATAPAEPTTPTSRDPGVGAVLRVAGLFVVVVGGIYTGLATVTETAALGAALSIVLFLTDPSARRGGDLIPRLREGLHEAVGLTGMIFALLAGAAVFTYFLVSAGVPSAFTEWVLGFDLPPLLVVALLLAAFIPLGMFLDAVSMMLIGVPLAYPVITELGFDGLWFAILVVKTIEIGLVTPPFGLNAYVLAGSVKEVSLEQAFRGLLWFVPVDLATIAVIFAFPTLTTWLPDLMR